MSLYISHSKPKLSAPLALPRLSEYLTPEACLGKLGKLARDKHKLVMRLTKKEFALEDFGPKSTELEAEALALDEEVAYLDALLPRLPAGKTRSKREYRRAQAAAAHSRCLRKLEKFSGPAHVALQAEVDVLAAKVENFDVAISMLEDHLADLEAQQAAEVIALATVQAQEESHEALASEAQIQEIQRHEEEKHYIQAAKAMVFMVWCWQQSCSMAKYGASDALVWLLAGMSGMAFTREAHQGLGAPFILSCSNQAKHATPRPPPPPRFSFSE